MLLVFEFRVSTSHLSAMAYNPNSNSSSNALGNARCGERVEIAFHHLPNGTVGFMLIV